jgi:hypothetical protein
MAKFVRGQPKTPGSGKKKGSVNKNISERSDKKIVDKIVTAAENGDPNAQRMYLQYLRPRPPQPRLPTFAPKPFELNAMATLADAALETQRIAGAVANGELDHDTGQFLIAAIRAFAETLTGVKLEKEIAAADALTARDKS